MIGGGTPLTGATLATLTQKLMLNVSIDSTIFYQLLNLAQGKFEQMREWSILKKSDTTQTASGGDTFTTSKALPSDFNFWQSDDPIILYQSGNTQSFLKYFEIPFSMLYREQTSSLKYTVDYAGGLVYLMGSNLPATYVIQQNYIYKPAEIASGTSWVFPARFHQILAYEVGLMYELGTDYDDLKAATGNEKKLIRDSILDQMIQWDARLQTQSLDGVNRGIDDPRWPIAKRIDMN